MMWDQTYFYIGAELVEPHLWGTLTEHDSVIFRDNDFEVFIDPNGDNHEYYELEINALGTTWDLLLPKPYKDDGKAVNGWEIAGMKSAVHLDGTLNDPRDIDRGWTVEIALPWKALGELARVPSPPRDGDQWRVNFSRVQWQLHEDREGLRKGPRAPKEDNWVWSPQGVIDMHRPEKWGYVQFSTGCARHGEVRRRSRRSARRNPARGLLRPARIQEGARTLGLDARAELKPTTSRTQGPDRRSPSRATSSRSQCQCRSAPAGTSGRIR